MCSGPSIQSGRSKAREVAGDLTTDLKDASKGK